MAQSKYYKNSTTIDYVDLNKLHRDEKRHGKSVLRIIEDMRGPKSTHL